MKDYAEKNWEFQKKQAERERQIFINDAVSFISSLCFLILVVLIATN